MPRPRKPASPFRYFNSSPEVIRLVVMMYVRFPLSLRNVEDLLFERGIDLSYETVRFWWNRFGPLFAADINRQRVSRMKGFKHWQWHLDEMYVKIGGDRFASRMAWRLGYNSQRVARRDRPFEKLFRLQKKLGADEGWEAGLPRPKGMWHRTYERHFKRYLELDEQCGAEMMSMVLRLGGRL